MLGLSGDLMKLLSAQLSRLKSLKVLCTDLANNRLDHEEGELFRCAKTYALPKPGDKPRPLGNLSAFVKLTGNMLMARIQPTLESYFAPIQRALGVKGGVEGAVIQLNLWLNSLGDMPEIKKNFPNDPIVGIRIDRKNAFNETRIANCLEQFYANSDWEVAFAYVDFLYGGSNRMLVFDGSKCVYTIEREEGTMQGEQFAQLLYCVGDRQFAFGAAAQSKYVQVVMIADDMTLVGPLSEALKVLRWSINNCESMTGNVVEPKKTHVLVPNGYEYLKHHFVEFIPHDKLDEKVHVGAMPFLG